jgi:hypothetical protein
MPLHWWPISERGIRARLARPTTEAHRGCAAKEENAAGRDAGPREPAIEWRGMS